MGRSPPLAISYYVPENQVINFTPIHDLVVKVVMAGYYILTTQRMVGLSQFRPFKINLP